MGSTGYGRIAHISDLSHCAGKRIVLDTETTGLHWWHDKMIGIGYYCPDIEEYGYIPVADYLPDNENQRFVAVPNDDVIAQAKEQVQAILRNPKTILCGHNLKFDAHFLGINLWEVPGKIIDTTVMIHLYDDRLNKGMDKAEVVFLGRNSKRNHVQNAIDMIPKKAKKDFTLWPLPSIADYCVNDCIVTHQLFEVLKPKLQELGLASVFKKDMAYLATLQRIEQTGIRISPEYCRKAVRFLQRNLTALQEELFETVGRRFNLNSPRQLSEAIYASMGIPLPKNPFVTADGRPSNHPLAKKYNDTCTSKEVLEHEKHPLAPLIADIREAAKLKVTVSKWLELADDNMDIHASFNLTGTKTGRLSCREPNLQNIASAIRSRGDNYDGDKQRVEEYNLREAFVARPGHIILAIDHSQQEIRLLAILSQEPKMLEGIRNREDMHLRVAQEIWGGREDWETNKGIYRKNAKSIQFALLYGLSLRAMAFRTGESVEYCQQIMADYWTTFSFIQPWQEKIQNELRLHHFTRYWSDRIWRESSETLFYRGVNAQIQGGSADLMSIAVLRCVKILDKHGWGRIINIVHDELVFEIKEVHLPVATKTLLKTMEVEDLFGFPFVAEAKVGYCYGSLTPYTVPEERIEVAA